MIHLIIILPVLLFSLVYALWIKKYDVNYKIKKIIAVILFVSFGGTLFYEYAIDDTVALQGIFSPGFTVFMVFLRWFTTIITALAIISPFYGGKSLKRILEYIAPIICVLNIIFINQNLIANYGNDYLDNINYRLYFYIAQIIVLSSSVFTYLFDKIKNKNFNENKIDIRNMFIMLIILMPPFFQQGALEIFFGEFGQIVSGFNGIHRITLYFTIIISFLIFILMRNKSKEDKDLLFAVLSFSALVQYFYEYRSGLDGLPLHLCNTAVVLMFFGFVFKIRGIFYFTYFVNVIGAIAAMILPNGESDAFSVTSVHFWYNHIYAAILPILGVALRVYPRPNFKMMKAAIAIFTLYFLTVVFINAWFNNYETVDYFFVYGDFFPDKFSFVIPIKYEFILEIPFGDLVFRFYYLMQLLIYFGFIFLMFLMWIVYDYLYKVSDLHYELSVKKKKDKMDLLNLKAELNGRELSEPIDVERINMIQIENFTKVYGNNKYKSVDDFSLTVNNGEVFGFLGHNGAGKSTTIKSMVGIQSITHGKILIDGYDISKQPLEAKLRMGYVSDNHAVYEKLTGREYINYVADLYLVSQEDREERIEKYVKMFNLQQFIDHEIRSYSHGMKQKIVVIASLIHNPKIWILDEPLTGLDPASAYEIKECMREHANNGNIVFFSSHVIEVVEKVCDRICIISKGKLQGIYSLKELKEQGISLEKLYMQHIANEK